MRRFILACFVLLTAAGIAVSAPAIKLTSKDGLLAFMNAYEPKRDFSRAPQAMKAASDLGVLTDPEGAGMYVGFMAGLIGANTKGAPVIIEKLLQMRAADHWAIVRAIAYSGHPDWRGLMQRFRPKMPTRDLMAQRYLEGKLPTFDTPPPEKKSWLTKANPVNWFKKDPDEDTTPLNERADIVDVHWGMYFARRDTLPLMRMVELLPWAEDRDSFERLTIGSMVKYTMAMNASRDSKLLERLKSIHAALPPVEDEDEDPKKHLADALEAAQTMEIALLRRDALARMEDLKRMGPGSHREVAWWGKVGQGALALGCVAAAATGVVAAGLPCVIGGAATSAALNFWAGG